MLFVLYETQDNLTNRELKEVSSDVQCQQKYIVIDIHQFIQKVKTSMFQNSSDAESLTWNT